MTEDSPFALSIDHSPPSSDVNWKHNCRENLLCGGGNIFDFCKKKHWNEKKKSMLNVFRVVLRNVVEREIHAKLFLGRSKEEEAWAAWKVMKAVRSFWRWSIVWSHPTHYAPRRGLLQEYQKRFMSPKLFCGQKPEWPEFDGNSFLRPRAAGWLWNDVWRAPKRNLNPPIIAIILCVARDLPSLPPLTHSALAYRIHLKNHPFLRRKIVGKEKNCWQMKEKNW